jgi:prepilin-type N-terminal cleavage/methylation domain-containing protein
VTLSRRGFTLVELAVVLFILAVSLSILLPRLPGLSQGRKNAALRQLAAVAQALHEEAAFKKKAWL